MTTRSAAQISAIVGRCRPRHTTARPSLCLRVLLLGALLWGAPIQQAAAAPNQVGQVAGLEVAFWLPLAGSAGPRTLILFSHGFGGCKTQSDFLMRALADSGMVVAAPDHRDNQCTTGRPPTCLPQNLVDPRNWSPTFYDDRRDDMRRLRAELERNGTPAGPVDPTRVVLVGHSLGGYTALALAGGWPAWRSDGVAAVVALAPFAQPLIQSGGALGTISAPVLF
jgi:predicted dienelactone hydrolase